MVYLDQSWICGKVDTCMESCSIFPFLFHPFPFSSSFPHLYNVSLPYSWSPLNLPDPTRKSWECRELPHRVWAEPGRQTILVHSESKIMLSYDRLSSWIWEGQGRPRIWKGHNCKGGESKTYTDKQEVVPRPLAASAALDTSAAAADDAAAAVKSPQLVVVLRAPPLRAVLIQYNTSLGVR